MRLSLPDEVVKLDLLEEEGNKKLRSQQALDYFMHGFPPHHEIGCLKISIFRRSR